MSAPVNMHSNNWRTHWTADMDEVLRRERADGKSFSEAIAVINKAFGTFLTRNSAIGRASRIGVALRPQSPPKPKARPNPKPATKTVMRAVPVTNARGKVTFRMKPKTVLADDKIDRKPLELGPSAVTFFDAQPSHCRWPYGDPRDLETFRFCGEIAIGQSYCCGHARQAKGSGAP